MMVIILQKSHIIANLVSCVLIDCLLCMLLNKNIKKWQNLWSCLICFKIDPYLLFLHCAPGGRLHINHLHLHAGCQKDLFILFSLTYQVYLHQEPCPIYIDQPQHYDHWQVKWITWIISLQWQLAVVWECKGAFENFIL